MSIVAISETLGSLADEVARELGQMLGYEVANREIITKAAERFGESVVSLAHVTEEKPTFWERFSDTQRQYLSAVEATIFEMAARDNVILSGRSASILLAKVRHTLRVRISAPESVRAQRVEHAQGLTTEAALDVVRQVDDERAARVRFHYHVDVDDPLLYDVVINTERMSAPTAARLLRETLADERWQPTPDSLTKVRDLSVVAQIKAALLANPVTRACRLYPTCEDGNLLIGGMVDQEEQRKAAADIIGGIPGLRGVQNEIVVVHPGRRMGSST
jgi:cytidylate kinase